MRCEVGKDSVVENRLSALGLDDAGPEDTPYFGGCFVFDIYCPPEYPAVPPLMTLETTGAGRARYNPNLYADGKARCPTRRIILLLHPISSSTAAPSACA